ncbi:hypothetical protein DPEC_G00332170 [Dallia pectoralis]|uniref:Uncharacterized protein n=1 Tax=Dallia pectoralis TaxID=75939 RepID=A0ACC2F615_DALPE|nr:hypothetical protein DPEC_G00332170 [Dallia pectoralis]
MYYITKLGRPIDFSCDQLPAIRYFRVGAENNCTAINCNGILPSGSTVRVKYLLIDPVSRSVVSESQWSKSIVLTTTRSWSSIDESIENRSGGMVVITIISSCLLAVLLLLVGVVLLLDL